MTCSVQPDGVHTGEPDWDTMIAECICGERTGFDVDGATKGRLDAIKDRACPDRIEWK